MSKLAVIVPIYNVEPYIEQCINSLTTQTMRDIEIICVDDCGTDKSMEIVKRLAKTDERIKVIHNKLNSGLSESRNNGVRACDAEYIMFCDSDDWFTNDMCEKMYNAITADGADIAICGTEVIYEADFDKKSGDDNYFAVRHNGTINNDPEIMRWYAVCAWNKIYKRAIMTEHDVWFPKGLKYEDEFFFPAYLNWVDKVAFVPEKLYKYRRRAGSIMSAAFNPTKQKLDIDNLKIAFAYFEYAKHNDCLDKDRFWIQIFDKMLKCALARNTEDKHHTIYDTANEFILNNYSKHGLWFYTQCVVEDIINRRPPVQKYLGGLFHVRTTPLKREWCIGSTPIWKIKRSPTKIKYYLFGIRIAHKCVKPYFPKPRQLIKVQLDDSQLINELKKIGKFTYIPNPGNAGDMLIAAATMGFFEKHKLPYKMYDTNTNIDTVVYGGGGIWTADYKKDWIKHLAVLTKAKKIVILPSSFNNCPELIDAMDERFVVFCREKRSYEYIKGANTRATVLLDHDMAFRMTTKQIRKPYKTSAKMLDALNQVDWGQIPKNAMFMRADGESTGKYKTDLDVSELAGWYSLSAKPGWIDFCAQLMLSVVNQADAVVTDRLHVAIAGLLTGKTVYMLDNTYGKLSAVYEHSMKQFENVHFCTTMPEFVS